MCKSEVNSNGALLAPITAGASQMADVIHRFVATAGRETSECAAQEPGDKGESKSTPAMNATNLRVTRTRGISTRSMPRQPAESLPRESDDYAEPDERRRVVQHPLISRDNLRRFR
jgi:hypothetical protein